MWGMAIINNYANRYPLHQAIQDQDIFKVQALLDGKNDDIDVNEKDWEDYTPLHKASSGKKNEIVSLLLKYGADPNVKECPFQPLHWAVYLTKFKTIQLLLDYGANVKAQDKDGETPLYLACGAEKDSEDNGRSEIVSLLLKHGADPNVKKGPSKWTPLHWSASFNQLKNAQLLIAHGADINTLNDSQQTPLDIARIMKKKEIFNLLNNTQEIRYFKLLQSLRNRLIKKTDHLLQHFPDEILTLIAKQAKEQW